MLTKIFTKEEWLQVLQGLQDTYQVYVPVKDRDFHSFKSINEGKRPDFTYQNTRLSAKSLIYPQSERLFEYSLDKNTPDAHVLKEAAKDFSPQAIVGMRPCDVHALQIIAVNFHDSQYGDPWWVQRSEATTLVGLGCNDPCSTCFCTSVGGGPFDVQGMDALMYDMGDSFLVRSLTEKGIAFIEKAGHGSSPEDSILKKAEDLAISAAEKIKAHVRTDKLSAKVVNELFEASFWEEVAFPCINCGTCTYLCPTCWCFDIQDEVLGKTGDRIRNWDSCMFPLFTLHASGHNPREENVQRVRQRFMHKLKYYVDKYHNGVQCSGCGRCVKHCPVNIDIRQVFELMNSY